MTTTQLSNAVRNARGITPEQLAALRERYVDPRLATAHTQQQSGPIVTTDAQGRKRTILPPTTRLMVDTYEPLEDRQRRLRPWEDHTQPFEEHESTIDDFQNVQFRRSYANGRISSYQTARDIEQLDEPRDADDSAGIPRPALPTTGRRQARWVKHHGTNPQRKGHIQWVDTPWIVGTSAPGDWEQLQAIDLNTGELTPLWSELHPDRPLSRMQEGFDRHELASPEIRGKVYTLVEHLLEDAELVEDERWSVDFLDHPGWHSTEPELRSDGLTLWDWLTLSDSRDAKMQRRWDKALLKQQASLPDDPLLLEQHPDR